MKYFSIYIEDLESERLISSSNDQIATWLLLHAFCSKQTNGGFIKEAATLPERFWSRHGITADILRKPSPLWTWNDSDLSVHLYDIEGERLYLKKVEGGKAGGRGRGNRTPNRSPNRSPNRTPDRTPDREETILEETRPEEKRSSNSSSADEGGGSLFPEADSSIQKKKRHELFEYWNTFQELPKIRDVPTKRQTQLNARMKEDFFRDNWKTAIARIVKTPFLTGTNERGWKADIDWLLTQGNLVKIMEGKYDTQQSKPISQPNLGGRASTNTEEV